MSWFLGICILLLTQSSSYSQHLKMVAEWKTLDFVFPGPDDRQLAIRSGNFIPGNCVPIDVDIDYQENSPSRIFVTIPRFVTGIPVTLGYIFGSRNLIAPYPSYSWHSSHGKNCDGITSVFRIAVSILEDLCNSLSLYQVYNLKVGLFFMKFELAYLENCYIFHAQSNAFH